MRSLLLLCCLLLVHVLPAQTALNFFKPISEAEITLPETAQRKLVPLQYRAFQLDYSGIKTALQAAPPEFSKAALQHACVISLPLADGTFEDFAVWEIPTLEPALAALAPYVRTFAGESLADRQKTVRLSYTLKGFQAMILRPDLGVEYIDRYAEGQTTYYMAYDRKALAAETPGQPPAGCGWKPSDTPEKTVESLGLPAAPRGDANPVMLRTYKYVCATTGEYGQDHGPTKDDVFSAVTEHTNRVNALLERDCKIRLQLIQASLLVIYLNPATDPFTGNEVGDWMSQNPGVLEAAGIPGVAYDLGHVLARYLAGGAIGIAGGQSCASSRARGCSAGTGAYGDGFIKTYAHEVGHQLSAGHSWNSCGPGNSNRAGSSAWEPGSGTTIMSYSGACGSDNIPGGGDLYYHSGTIEQIRTYTTTLTGSQCGTLTNTGNTDPVLALDYTDGFHIPWGTPFELQGQASDPDGDPLLFTWEQIDIGPEVALGQQEGNSPLFRSYPPAPATNRYFPNLGIIRSNGTNVAELLPGNWTRDLTFRMTARDNRSGLAWADVAFKAWGSAGPFLVTHPNTSGATWNIGEYTEVRWDVANTDKAPVNCSHVNIRLSTDGGQTYPHTLATGVTNDGSHYVRVPDLPGTSARVRIDAAASVFFDISNANFRIQQPTQPSLTLGLNNDSGILCLPAEHEVGIHTAGVQGFSSPVNLEIISALPANVTAAFSATTLQPGESASLKLDFSNVTVEETFTITVQATAAGVAPIQRDIVLTTLRNDFSALALNLPADGATEQDLSQTLYWTKALDALTYDVQFANDPSFDPATILASISGTKQDSYKVPVFLAKGMPYYWRVRPVNECGPGPWTEPFFFSTFAEACFEWSATDLPKVMTANGTPTIESKISVNAGGIIKSMEVRQLKGYHEFFKDLDVHLISPKGTDLTLWSAKCGNFNGFFNLRLTDEAPGGFPCPPPNTGQAYRPANPLSAFTGEDATGVWTLRARDTEFGGGGAFEIFKLEFCSEVQVNPPYLVNNNTLIIDPGANRAITPDLLLCEDADNTHSELQYTLVTVPAHGYLSLNGSSALKPGDQFTQAQVDNSALRYYDNGGSYTDNGFRFMVTDGEGGFFGTPKFRIGQLVDANEPGAAAPGFRLFPNPAGASFWIATEEPLQDVARVVVFNTAGQRMQEALLASGTTRLLLNTADWPRGLYVVQVGGSVRKLVLR